MNWVTALTKMTLSSGLSVSEGTSAPGSYLKGDRYSQRSVPHTCTQNMTQMCRRTYRHSHPYLHHPHPHPCIHTPTHPYPPPPRPIHHPPVDKPLQYLCYQIEVGFPKVLHRYHPGVAQGAHHLGEVWRSAREQTRMMEETLKARPNYVVY